MELEEGTEESISIGETALGNVTPGKNVLEDIANMAKALYEQFPDDGQTQPADGSINYKHYLYGHRKKVE